MTETNPSPEDRTDQTRREALEKFGKYAAAASAFTILLQPHAGHAQPGKSHGKGRKGLSFRKREKRNDNRHY